MTNLLNSSDLTMLLAKIVKENPQLTLQRVDATTGELVFLATANPLNPNHLSPLEIEHLQHGRTIMAIKCLRERLQCGLKEAKDRVDEYRNMSNIPF